MSRAGDRVDRGAVLMLFSQSDTREVTGVNGASDSSVLKELMQREQECVSSNRRYSSLARDIGLTTMINGEIQREKERLRALRRLVGDELSVHDDVFEEQVYSDQPGGPNPKGYRPGGTAGTEPLSQAFRDQPSGDNVGWRGAPAGDANYARTDSLLGSRPPPDVDSEDPAILEGSREAAKLMVGIYAEAASRVAGAEVRRALEAMLADCRDYLRRLEDYVTR